VSFQWKYLNISRRPKNISRRPRAPRRTVWEPLQYTIAQKFSFLPLNIAHCFRDERREFDLLNTLTHNSSVQFTFLYHTVTSIFSHVAWQRLPTADIPLFPISFPCRLTTISRHLHTLTAGFSRHLLHPTLSRSFLSWCQSHMGSRQNYCYSQTVAVFVDVGCPLWWEEWCVVYSCCWPSLLQTILGSNPAGLMILIYCSRFEISPTEAAGSRSSSHQDQGAPIISHTLVSHFYTTYISQSCGGCFRIRHYTGSQLIHDSEFTTYIVYSRTAHKTSLMTVDLCFVVYIS
jgi:hypothetical protein